MITIDGNWVMEGLEYEDDSNELTDLVNKIGFLPLFKNNIKGFSVEERTAKYSWWSGPLEEDPWEWRSILASEGIVAYGKVFMNKAGFVSKEWYPVLASYRRDGYDFDSRYEDGLASRRSKNIIDVLSHYETLPSYEIKTMAGFHKDGEKGFESTINSLQMQTYITVRGFQRKRSKKNEEYGWPVALYSLSERLYGEDHVRSAYHKKAEDAKYSIVEHLHKIFPESTYDEIAAFIR
ncbi:MAG: hypothetical protein K0S47_4215 [Herbinix sp.]|nr:hypothetical protein [Herbinix sp.]